jgi:hypothetical protein
LNGEEGELHLSTSVRSWPFGLIALSLIAAVLLILLLGNATYKPAGGGESLMAQAFEMLFIIAALWFVLLVMLLVGLLGGAVPRWATWLMLVLVPMAAIADAVAVDMCGRHMEWAVVLVAALPLLVAFYAWWGRLPRLQAALPAERTSALVWGSVFLLSAVTFALGA